MILIAAVFIFFIFLLAYPDSPSSSQASPYTQLIGFSAGGEFFLNNYLSDWSTGVFFENVINPWFGFEIEMARSSTPITSYTQVIAVNPQTYYGTGKLDYIEMSGALKVYIQGIGISFGITYNSFNSGYIVVNTNNYYQTIGDGLNYFSIFFGPELTAQISSDLFTKVGIIGIYGILDTIPNYNIGFRFYISFAYGI